MDEELKTNGEEKTETKKRVVMVSGGFDPLHLGHLLSFQAAKALGDKLIVVIDGDEFLVKKKGAPFMPVEDRVAIIKELRCVDEVVVIGDGDISDAIIHIKPDVFANGGDKNSLETIPKEEREACEKVGCKIVFNVGGGKIRSSSVLLDNWIKNNSKNNQ
ncbi:MAG TPA: adenylyltransferase/cytidyltransferase family protein [Candidatus Nanoarchaeia archaeon]|nr:adenylyltransferase/cytidyltransferase family protein [Candidatus Nanoarchaeia archaeon]